MILTKLKKTKSKSALKKENWKGEKSREINFWIKRNKRKIKKETEMFTRVRKLNNEFKNIKEQKKKKKRKWIKQL